MQQLKAFQIRIPKETWIFLKKAAAEQERTMCDIVAECLEKYKRKFEKKLTPEDRLV